MKWINILHLYQPPTQTREVVDLVVKESYSKIVDLLDLYPKLRLTINISGSLLELLRKYGHSAVIEGFKRHVDKGAVELMASAMYHPILPLLSASEIKRQIDLNMTISQECFGSGYAPKGFYFPEMAYSREAAQEVRNAGFEWTVLDEIHSAEKIDWDRGYDIKGVGLKAVFRDSRISRTFPPEAIVKELTTLSGRSIVTCHDGEMYGHWHKEDYGYYGKAFSDPNIVFLTASQYIDALKNFKEIEVRDASWESSPEELKDNVTLALWNDPHNDIHQILESLKRQVLLAVESHQDDPGYEKARYHADRGVASCAWWWASERQLGPFSPITWNPTEIEKGAKELESAFLSLNSVGAEEKVLAKAKFEGLFKLIWEKHKKKSH